MNTKLCLKSIEAQLDRIERHVEVAQNTFAKLEAMMFEAKLRGIKSEKTATSS